MRTKISIIALLVAGLCFWGGASQADETELFTTSTAPDALIILDLSYSMEGNPSDGTDTTNIYGNTSCSGTYYSSSGSGHTTNCRRINIAKRTIFDILDDNDDNTINSSDATSLGIRFGYMRFKGCDSSASYSSGNNTLINAIDTKYSYIFCRSNTSCTSSSTSTSECVNSATTSPGTPIADSLKEAKLYLDAHKASDTNCSACRQKFVVLVTDGADTCVCGGSGNTELVADMYKRRRASVAAAKALADAGYRVFVIGFGASMPDHLEKTLNWMAYYGGTDNPLTVNSGNTSGYNPSLNALCDNATTTGTCTGSSSACYAAANDPGTAPLSGYAFLAADGDQLAAQLKAAITIIREATYSFSQASIQSSRTADENYIYAGSFQPRGDDPFWFGHLKKFPILSDGNVDSENPLWDAGTILQGATAAGRNIKTYKAGAQVDFTTANITNTNLGVATGLAASVIGFIRGDSTYSHSGDVGWKLGDVFRSTPVTVGTPSAFYDDVRDTGGSPNGFAYHRTNHPRSSGNGQRIIVIGANDGQLRAFKTSDGSEAWSFIPPNELSRLQMIVHTTDTTLTHQYYVDGPVTVSDAWVPASAGTGTTKSSTDWKTLLIFGEGRGAGTNLWSSSSSCDSGFNQIYTSSYPYYCGYYCLDVTNTLTPTYKWSIGKNSSGVSATGGPYMGNPWGKPMIGRVKVSGNEKWVAFIGGGVYTTGAVDSGKGFFVIDLVDGSILWSYTKADNSSLDNPMPTPPAIVDTDNDGFIDTAYAGDMGSNMWRFKMCRASDGSSCGTSNWSGGRLFEASAGSGIRPIYTSAAVAVDTSNNLWVYWGTGDKTDPTAANAQEKFFGVKDNDRTTTYTVSDLQNITSAGNTYNDTGKDGFYMNLPGTGEKMLADPTVFGGVVYFTTYTPSQGNTCCETSGTASLYGLKYTTGGAGLSVGGTDSRSTTLGTGIATAPIISLKPGTGTPDLYVTASGGGGNEVPFKVGINIPGVANRTNMLYWKDRRLE
jgi:hypothetical protein